MAHLITGRDGTATVVNGAQTGSLALCDIDRQVDVLRLAEIGDPKCQHLWHDFTRDDPSTARLVREYSATRHAERQEAVRHVDIVLAKPESSLPPRKDYGDRFQTPGGVVVPEPDWHREKRARKMARREAEAVEKARKAAKIEKRARRGAERAALYGRAVRDRAAWGGANQRDQQEMRELAANSPDPRMTNRPRSPAVRTREQPRPQLPSKTTRTYHEGREPR